MSTVKRAKINKKWKLKQNQNHIHQPIHMSKKNKNIAWKKRRKKKLKKKTKKISNSNSLNGQRWLEMMHKRWAESAQITLILSVKIAFHSISRTICSLVFLSFMTRMWFQSVCLYFAHSVYVAVHVVHFLCVALLNHSAHIHSATECMCDRWKWSVAAYSLHILYTYTTQSVRVCAWIDVSVYYTEYSAVAVCYVYIRCWYFVGLSYRIFESPPLNLGDLDSLTHYVYIYIYTDYIRQWCRTDTESWSSFSSLSLSLSPSQYTADKLYDTGHAYSLALSAFSVCMDA